MDLKDTKIIRTVKNYIKRKHTEALTRQQDEKIKEIVKELLFDKSPKETIKMLKAVVLILNERLDIKLQESNETTEEILNFKKLI